MENTRIRPLLGLPLADRVIIQPDSPETIRKSGIIIPDSAKEAARSGVVRSVGAGRDGQVMTVRVGDHVLYGKFAGSDLTVDGEELTWMRESDVVYIIAFAPDEDQDVRQQEALTSQGFTSPDSTLPAATKVTLEATVTTPAEAAAVAAETPAVLKAAPGGFQTLAEALEPLTTTLPKDLGPKSINERLAAAASVVDPAEFSRLETMVFSGGMSGKISEYLPGHVTALVRKYDGVEAPANYPIQASLASSREGMALTSDATVTDLPADKA